VAVPAVTTAPTVVAVPVVPAAPVDAVAPVDTVAPTVAAAPIDAAAPAPAVPRAVTRRRPSEITESELIHALRVSEWSLKAAADHLGIARASIYDVIGRFPNVRTAGDLTPAEIELCHCECGGDLDRMVARLCVSRRALGRRVKELGLAIAKR
jgi:two-component system, NtrC family, nitrogen regulation response regulator GlnG